MYGYIPNVPGALFAPPPRTKAALSEQSLVEAMPPPATAAEQIGMVHLLSEPTKQPLGRYAPEFFAGNPEIAPIVERFDAALHAIARQIDARNAQLAVPYTYLHPAFLYSSIEI
jgi:arachidonate 12-lipoxygenase